MVPGGKAPGIFFCLEAETAGVSPALVLRRGALVAEVQLRCRRASGDWGGRGNGCRGAALLRSAHPSRFRSPDASRCIRSDTEVEMKTSATGRPPSYLGSITSVIRNGCSRDS